LPSLRKNRQKNFKNSINIEFILLFSLFHLSLPHTIK
jgi:hypothetical protein